MKTIMKRVYWALGGETYATYDDFITAVTEYNNTIDPDGNEWDPDHIVSMDPIKVVYEASWKDENDSVDLSIGAPGTPVTMGRVLFTINNETYEFFRETDTHYFEGLAFMGGKRYELIVGS